MESRWNLFFYHIQQDLKIFAVIWFMLNVLRIVSVGIMHQYIEAGSGWQELILSFYYGARISLKTAGLAMLFSFLLATLPAVICRQKKKDNSRLLVSGLYLLILFVLFLAKIPYYAEFHTGFNQMMFNGLQDDWHAIFYTFVQEYHLFASLLLAGALTFLSTWFIRKILNTPVWQLPISRHGWFRRGILASFLLAFCVFVRFGGSLVYAHSLHWENAAMSKDSFLNEMILDDVQAVYRGWSIKKRIETGTADGVYQDKLQPYLRLVNPAAAKTDDIDKALVRTAKGSHIARPKHIFILIGESYAQWPLLDKYQNLHLADGVRTIMQQENAACLTNFMPNGAFTPMAVNALICGLADVNIYPNQQPESYRQIYEMALAPQLKKLGYKTCFWYAGFSSWERIKDFALAQGFDEFHSASDLPYASGNVWGCDDQYMFAALEKQVENESEPTVHVILTVSNHAPYSVDLEKAGFDSEGVRAALPAGAKDDKELLRRLGHYWYTDKMISEFVKTAYNKYPQDSLFILTGDHADRTNIDAKPVLFERYTIPCVFYGQGITKAMFAGNRAGGQIDLAPTLFELIAPAGFTYTSLGHSLLEEDGVGFNHKVWLTPAAIGVIGSDQVESLGPATAAEVAADQQAAWQRICALRTISWWRTMKGSKVE